jgi:hypothetical protein
MIKEIFRPSPGVQKVSKIAPANPEMAAKCSQAQWNEAFWEREIASATN